MTDYTKTTNFTVKDTLVSGNPAKIIRGSEFDTEFNNIQVSVATKANIASPSFTGDVTVVDGDFVGNLIGNVTGNVVGNVTGTASNAAQLDNLDSTQFLRSDVSDTFTNLTGSTLTSNIVTDNVDGTGNLVFERNALEKMRLTSDGSLLLGTSQDLGEKFRVFNFESDPATTEGKIAAFTGQLSGKSFTALNIRHQDSLILALAGVNDALAFGSNNTERMRLTSDGKLFVNSDDQAASTSAPVVFTEETAGVANALELRNKIGGFNGRGVALAFTGLFGGGTDATINSFTLAETKQLHFNTDEFLFKNLSGTERMRLTSSGYLKVDPSGEYINAVGSVNLTGRSIHQFNSSTNDVTFGVYNTNSSFNAVNIVSELNANAGNHIFAATNAGQVFVVKSNGDIIGGAGSSFSDIKLKENIEDASPKLEDISKIRFVNYNFKEGPRAGNKEFGVIAQELEEIFPNLIINTPDTEEVEVTKTETFETSEPVLDENGEPVLYENGEPVTTTKTEEREVTTTETRETGEVTKSVKYSVLTLMAVKALQELKAEKDELEAKYESLLSRVEALEAK